jgi:hypothetical protein
MAEGDIESVLSVYDPEAVFLNESGEVKKGVEGLREELALLRPRRPSLTSTSSRSSGLATSR